jgi:hypothetical protein
VPLLLLLAFTLFVILAAIALTPLMLVQRYRVGTARRRAWGWLATLNVVGFSISSALFLAGAAIMTLWLPNALPYTVLGFCGGCLLGVLGLAMTRWESGPGSLQYTPNRWLVLGITVVVAARLAFGFWRSWQAWGATSDYGSWVASSGVAGSLAAGAVVLGYYLTYWIGVRRRLRRLQTRTARGSR